MSLESLDDSVKEIRELQQRGAHLARLAAYMAVGIHPARQHIVNAQRWFNEASEKLEPTLQMIEANRASKQLRPSFRG